MKDLFQNILIVLSVVVLAASCYNEDNRILPTCADGIQNQEEERVDCGGPACDPCPPSCDNGVLDYVDGWQEVGIDCGGPCEELGQSCCDNLIQDINEFEPTLSENWVDCKFPDLNPGDVGFNSECGICNTCENGMNDPGEEITVDGSIILVIDCDDDPTTDCPPCIELCDDGLLNGYEGPCTDCGGSCLNCSDAHCFNGVQDTYPNDPFSNETAIDCGGCACVPCAILCGDGLLNGSEVAIDCGGNDCVPCNDFVVLCNDGIQNGYETAIDCYDGTDGASSCPPCQVLCNDGIQNGVETDTDCGSVDCGPCGTEETGYLTYMVDGVLYESEFTSISASRVTGTISAPDVIQLSGGISHSMNFILLDEDLIPNQWGLSTKTVNNITNVTDPNSMITFTDNDFTAYEASPDATGITVQFSPPVQYLAPLGIPPVGGLIQGTFSGSMVNGSGEVVAITNGMFLTWFVN